MIDEPSHLAYVLVCQACDHGKILLGLELVQFCERLGIDDVEQLVEQCRRQGRCFVCQNCGSKQAGFLDFSALN